MEFVRKINHRMTLWKSGEKYCVCSTSIDDSEEKAVFTANEEGEILSYNEIFIGLTDRTHAEIMEAL